MNHICLKSVQTSELSEQTTKIAKLIRQLKQQERAYVELLERSLVSRPLLFTHIVQDYMYQLQYIIYILIECMALNHRAINKASSWPKPSASYPSLAGYFHPFYHNC